MHTALASVCLTDMLNGWSSYLVTWQCASFAVCPLSRGLYRGLRCQMHCYVPKSIHRSGIVKITLLIHKEKYSILHLTLSWTAAKLLKLSFCTSAGRLEPFFWLAGSLTEEQLRCVTLKRHISDEPNVLQKLNVTECDLEGEIGLQNWQVHSGWPPRRSPSLVPLPVQLPESSPRACPRWHSCRTQPRSAPSPAAARPERLHTCRNKIRLAHMCDTYSYIHQQNRDLAHNNTQLLLVCS